MLGIGNIWIVSEFWKEKEGIFRMGDLKEVLQKWLFTNYLLGGVKPRERSRDSLISWKH